MIKNPKLILLVGPSGVGKGTIHDLLEERHPEYFYLPSVSTREMRPGEKEGDPYYFVSQEKFDEYIENGDLLEWGNPHGLARYGTLIKPAQKALDEGKNVVKEMEMKGLKKALEKPFAKNIYTIFLMPPSEESLLSRINKRGKLPDEEIQRRLESARREMDDSYICDTIIIAEEGEIEKIYEKVEKVIEEVTT